MLMITRYADQVTFYFPSTSLLARSLQISKWLSNDQDLSSVTIMVEILEPLSRGHQLVPYYMF